MLQRISRSARIACVALCALAAGVSMAGSAAPAPARKPVAILSGYPAPDTPYYEFAFRRQHAKVDVFDSAWLPTTDYAKYSVIVLSGNLMRAQIKPSTYTPDDIKHLQAFLNDGGTLILTGGSFDIFRSPAGGPFLEAIMGKGGDTKDKDVKLLQPQHKWVKELAAMKDLSWFTDGGTLLNVAGGQKIIGTTGGRATLFELPAGRGKIIYVGWSFAKYLPGGRNLNSTVEDEEQYEAQYHVLTNITRDLFPG